MEKQTSYQKKKNKIFELERQVRILVMLPDSLEANVIKQTVKHSCQLEKIVWFGDAL